MFSSASRPYPNAVWDISTTLSQLDASEGIFPLLSFFPYPHFPLGTSVVPPAGVACSAAAASLYFFLVSTKHPFRCSALIPEVPLDRLFHIHVTSRSILSFVGTKLSTRKV